MESKIDDKLNSLNKIHSLETKLHDQINSLDDKFQTLNDKIDTMENRLDNNILTLETKLDSEINSLKTNLLDEVSKLCNQTRYVDGTPTSEVTPVTIRYIRPPHHGHTSQYHGHEWMTRILFVHCQ